MKKLGFVSLMLVLAMLLAACGGSSIEGVWKLESITGDGNTALEVWINAHDASMTMIFKDGTLTMHMEAMGQSEDETATYKVDGNKLVIEGTTLDYSVKGKTLTLSADGMTMELTKK